jgi:hypothetical protein
MVIYQKMKIAISHFPGKVKKKHRESDKLISTLWLSVRFILSLNSICKGIKLYLHVVPDIDMAVCIVELTLIS